MIKISLTRAIEELVDMFFDNKNIRILYLTTSKTRQMLFDNILREIYQQDKKNVCRRSNLAKTIDFLGNHIEIKTLANDLRFTSYKFDIVFIDTKIDPKFHDEIRLSLRQNSVIPKEKQIQFFDIEEDKVWFEDEYYLKLLRDEQRMRTITDKLWREMIVSQKTDDCLTKDYIRQKLNFTEDKREDEEPMEMKLKVQTVGDIPYAYTITDVDIIKPDKVVKVYFVDGTNMKMVCHEEDTFDLRRCLFIAIAKKLYKDRYTCEGIEHKATELSYLKSVTKVVDKALKDFDRKQEAIAKLKKNAEEEKKSRAKKKAKHDAYLKRRDERRQKEIDEKNRQQFEYDVAVHVEAARRIKEMNPEYQVEKFCDDFCNDWDGK